jgi:enoyl-CoA hydratase/carnithine racemase
MAELVLAEMIADGVLQLMINRPERRNALNSEVLGELAAGISEAKEDADVRVIVLTGAGDKAFCAGGDLNPGAMKSGMLAMHEDRRGFVDLFQTMRAAGKPIIARVQSHCLAGGMGLMLGCDLAIAAESATFGTPEIKRGLFPMMIMALIFRTVGRRAGMEMILTGRRYDSAAAEKMGLVNSVVPDDQLDFAVLELANRIAGFSPAILKLGRDAFYMQEDMPFDQALEFLRSQLTINTLAEDAAEGIMSFFQKRPPKWKGR